MSDAGDIQERDSKKPRIDTQDTDIVASANNTIQETDNQGTAVVAVVHNNSADTQEAPQDQNALVPASAATTVNPTVLETAAAIADQGTATNTTLTSTEETKTSELQEDCSTTQGATATSVTTQETGTVPQDTADATAVTLTSEDNSPFDPTVTAAIELFQKRTEEGTMDLYALMESMEGSHQQPMPAYQPDPRSMQFESLQQPQSGVAQSYPSSRLASAGKNYWKDDAPALKKVEYNGESLMLPIVAPKDEPDVSIKQSIFKKITTSVENHQGGNKVNWGWKTEIHGAHMGTEVPALKIQAKQCLPSLSRLNTLNLYAHGDSTLYGNNVHGTELPMNDAGDNATITANSRRDCKFIGFTVTHNPQQATPQGAVITAADDLSTASQTRMCVRAPQNAGGAGLLNAITKDMLVNHPDQIFFQLGLDIDFLASNGAKGSNIPLKEEWDNWLTERHEQTYFYAMKKIGQTNCIGAVPPASALQQRFHGLAQRHWNPTTRKVEFRTVNEHEKAIRNLLIETEGMSAAELEGNVPELDNLFYHGLVDRLKERGTLAPLTSHARSTDTGQNLDRLQIMVNQAKEEERQVNQMVSISLSGQCRRNAVPASAQNTQASAGNGARTFATVDQGQIRAETETSPPRTGIVAAPAQYALTPAADTMMAQMAQLQQELDLAFTPLSSAEKAIQDSISPSQVARVLRCWGCDEEGHHFRKCPQRMKPEAQAKCKGKLEECISKRSTRHKFNPSHCQRDGFFNRNTVNLFNSIADPEANHESRRRLISAFIEECRCQGTGVATLRPRGGNQDEGDDHQSRGTIVFPLWAVDQAAVESTPACQTLNAATAQLPSSDLAEPKIRFPITSELPHAHIRVGKQGEAEVDGVIDTGGACTMGEYTHWSQVVVRFPNVVAQFDELENHQLRPVAIGGVGAGQVQITHVLGLWLPWVIGDQDTKLAIGLGENMPVTPLIGLPFLLAAQANIDLAEMRLFSKAFNAAWKMTLKRPFRKDERSLDAVMSTGKRPAFPAGPMMLPEGNSPKKVRWDWKMDEE